MSPLRILFVVPYIPSKMRVRPFAFIRELARNGHEITLVCLAQPASEIQYLKDVIPYCKTINCVPIKPFEAYFCSLSSIPTRTPLSVAYCKSVVFKKTIDQIIINNTSKGYWDIIHTEFIRAAPYTIPIKNIPKVFDFVDCLSLAYKRSLDVNYLSLSKRLISWIEFVKMKQYESEIVNHYDRIIVSSPPDKQALAKNNKHPMIVPNGVDLGYFSFSNQKKEPGTIVFLGKMNYYVNVISVLWFYDKVLPIIKDGYPQVRFKILGRDPAKSIRRLTNNPLVEVTGVVSDIRPHLANASVAIGPMITGSGIQNKILEAMSIGTPCVVTPIVSQALYAKPGKDILVADSEESFAHQVLELLQNTGKNVEIRNNGRQYVEQKHDWTAIGNHLVQIYSDLLNDLQPI